MTVQVLSSVAELRASLDKSRSAGARVGVIPTMGALHEVHLSLVREAAKRSDVVVVTIFVNPTQFGPGEDYDRYPRTLLADAELASGAGATLVFAPAVSEMYPSGEQTRVAVSGVSAGLCGDVRPGHFEGVATIVCKLFNAVGPGSYFFGRKDYQQWRLIERMAKDLLFPVEVVGEPTVRDPDGLALSSRNAYLLPEERVRALAVPHALQWAIDRFREGTTPVSGLLAGVSSRLVAGGLALEYAELRDAQSLAAAFELAPQPVVLLVAGRVGTTRLIDNVVLASGVDNIVPQGVPA
jgi:pantoate--beta-alanine ligase